MTDQDVRKPIEAAVSGDEAPTVVGYEGTCYVYCVRHAPKNARMLPTYWTPIMSNRIEPLCDLECNNPRCDTVIIRAADPERTTDILSLVLESITIETVATWTPAERAQAIRWAAATFAKASDHDNVQVPEQPAFVPWP